MPSSPTTMLGYVAAQTSKIILSTSTTLITTNDPVKIAEDFTMLQHLADGRVDLMMGRGNTGPVQARVDAAALAALDPDTDSSVLEGSTR